MDLIHILAGITLLIGFSPVIYWTVRAIYHAFHEED